MWLGRVGLFSQTSFADPPRKWPREQRAETQPSQKCVVSYPRLFIKLPSSYFYNTDSIRVLSDECTFPLRLVRESVMDVGGSLD